MVRISRLRDPTGDGRRPRQGDVDRVGRQPLLELARLELAARALEHRASSACRACVGRLPRPARAPRPGARRSRAGSRSARPCGPGSEPGAPRARRRRTPRRSPPPPRGESSAIFPWTSGTVGHPIRELVQAPRRPRIATFSESGPSDRIGIRARGVGPGDDVGRQPLALGAEAEDERRLEVDLAEDRARAPRRARAWMPRARRAPPSPAAGRTPTPCWPAPPSASRDRRIRARGPPARRRGRGRRG